MFCPEVTLGPPGCGKTETLIRRFLAELRRGVAPERIAVVTFTRAARQEVLDRALQRFTIKPSRFAWVRTVHSAAFRLLELRPEQILNDERLAEFAAHYGYELTIDGRRINDYGAEPLLVQGRSRDDLVLFAYEWGRQCQLDPERTLARCAVDDVSAPQFRLFAGRLEEFKAEFKLLDFSDLLEQVLERGLRPNVDVAMVDEAHDLSPLQIAVVEMWFADCPRSYVAADDDQAIFGWQGASPDWIHELAKRSKPTVLTSSKRVPVTVHALAQRIIAPNVHREPKAYSPADKLGRIVRTDLDGALAMVERSDEAFVLVRNRMFIARVARELFERAVPFSVEGWGGRSPLDDERAVDAVTLAHGLERGELGPFPTKKVSALVHLVPEERNWIAPDAKQQVRARRGQGSYSREDLVAELGFAPLLDEIESRGATAVLGRMPRDARQYFERLIQRYGEVPEPKTVVTTIHLAKGREALLVVVLPDMTRTTYAAYMRGGADKNEAENRAFYVAVTRTKDTLVLVEPRARRHYEFPRTPVVEGDL